MLLKQLPSTSLLVPLQAGDVLGVQRILQQASATTGFKHDEQSLKLLIDAYTESGLTEQAQQCSQQLKQLRAAAKAAKRATATSVAAGQQPPAPHRARLWAQK
jgi:hypothetical protein